MDLVNQNICLKLLVISKHRGALDLDILVLVDSHFLGGLDSESLTHANFKTV